MVHLPLAENAMKHGPAACCAGVLAARVSGDGRSVVVTMIAELALPLPLPLPLRPTPAEPRA